MELKVAKCQYHHFKSARLYLPLPIKRIVETMEVAIIGGGAAGFFLAVNLKTFAPQVEVTVFERQADVLKKY